MLKPKSHSTTITINEDDGVPLNMRRCMSMPTSLVDIGSIMKFRTVDESLHSAYGSEGGSRSGSRGNITFDRVEIREYARTVGDNPSCSSGPPVSIAWDYNILGEIQVEEYETTRPPRRSHFEMVLPRKVRMDMLRRDWDVTQRQIAEAVRRNVKVKNQRKATVNNLGKASKMEELMESAGRKFRRAIKLQKPVSVQVKDLEAKLDDANRAKSQYLLEIATAGEYAPSPMDTSASTC